MNGSGDEIALENEISSKGMDILHHSQRHIWLVVVFAVISLLFCAVYLEATVRHDIREKIDEEPVNWSDPQLRKYATACSVFSSVHRIELLRQVIHMKSTGLITTIATNELSDLLTDEDEQIYYAVLSVKTLPPNSKLISAFTSSAAFKLVKAKRVDEALNLIDTEISITTIAANKEMLLSELLYRTHKQYGLNKMLQIYDRYESTLQEIARADKVQETLATELAKEKRFAEARRIWQHLATQAENPHIRVRAQEKLDGGVNHGN